MPFTQANGSTIDGIRGRAGARNPFDTAVKPGRSLFERIEEPRDAGSRGRSRSPKGVKRTDTSKPAPEGVDRYVPEDRSRTRSPIRRGRRAEDGRGSGRGRGRETGNGRPRKTQEDLDKEMEDYWGSRGKTEVNGGVPAKANGEAIPVDDATTVTIDDGDIDMIE